MLLFDNWLFYQRTNNLLPLAHMHTHTHSLNIISHTFGAQTRYIVWISSIYSKWHWFSSSMGIWEIVWVWTIKKQHVYSFFSSSQFFFERFSHFLSYYPFIRILWIDLFSFTLYAVQSFSLVIRVWFFFFLFFKQCDTLLRKTVRKNGFIYSSSHKRFRVYVCTPFILLGFYSFFFFRLLSPFCIKIDGTFSASVLINGNHCRKTEHKTRKNKLEYIKVKWVNFQ